MKLIGLAGPARVGKDTVADYLVEERGFVKFSFSDALYEEVSNAFDVPVDALQRADLKECATQWLALYRCDNIEAINAMIEDDDDRTYFLNCPRSPRWVLQRWGTAYRRAQDPDYWIKKAGLFIDEYLKAVAAGDIKDPGGLVNTSVRFPNEQQFIRERGGEVWHIYRRDAERQHLNTYESERRLLVLEGDKELYNNSTVERLRTATALFLSTDSRRIILEGETPHGQQ